MKNEPMKILTVIGARPQFVKASAFSRAVSEHSGIQEVIVHTGQHFDANMSDVFFEELGIPAPTYNLNIHSLGHGAMTGRMLEGIEAVLQKEKPDVTLVYGDTNSTLAGALAAKKMHIRVAHVEAGLRSFDLHMPEEINRILTDRISDLLFCPTQTAVENLKKEGFTQFPTEICLSGDIMYDVALYYKEKAATQSQIVSRLNLEGESFVLATIHRQENTDNPHRLAALVDALNEIQKDQIVVLPIHPRTLKILEQNGLNLQVKVIDPVGYVDMVSLLSHCSMVLTDSGGLQKEAYFFGKYCLTLRDQTEWIELVDGGYNSLVGASSEAILNAYHKFREFRPVMDVPLYGNGQAAKEILKKLLE
jgi:UDP-GlcNAc3NAcA epimerase